MPQQAQPLLSAADRAIKRIFPRIASHLESILVAPWDINLDTKAKHEIDLTLKRLETTHFTEQATKTATMDVNEEPAADMQQLQELVHKQSEAQTTALKQQVNLLERKMQNLKLAKNSGKGNCKGASKQKEKTGAIQRSASQPRLRQKSKTNMRTMPRTIQAPSAQKGARSKIRRRDPTRARRVEKQRTTAETGNLQEDQISIRIPSGTQQDPWPQRISTSILHVILVLLQ
jgi:hypothetical protein